MNRLAVQCAGWSWAVVGLLAWAPGALACEPSFSCTPLVPFAAGSQIPASAVAIPVLFPNNGQGTPASHVQLLDASGQPVLIEVVADASQGWHLVKPLKGFKENASYTLRLESPCTAPGAATPSTIDTPFTTGAAAALPATFGTLQLSLKAPSVLSVWTAAGSCTVPLLVAQGEVALDGAPGLVPWLALTRAELWVDGLLWHRSAYGAAPLPNPPANQAPGYGRNAHSFHVPCGYVPKYADEGMAPGLHHVDLRLYIAGHAVQAPYLWGDIAVACTPGSTVDAGATADAANAPDAVQTGTQMPESAAQGGCAAGPRSPLSGWLLAVAAAALVVRRRRPVG